MSSSWSVGVVFELTRIPVMVWDIGQRGNFWKRAPMYSPCNLLSSINPWHWDKIHGIPEKETRISNWVDVPWSWVPVDQAQVRLLVPHAHLEGRIALLFSCYTVVLKQRHYGMVCTRALGYCSLSDLEVAEWQCCRVFYTQHAGEWEDGTV